MSVEPSRPRRGSEARALALLMALGLGLALAGCVDYGPLEEGRHGEVEPEVLYAAGNDDVEGHPEAVARLLAARRADSSAVGVEQALEGTIALGKIGARRHGPLLLDLAARDPVADVRYFAAEALARLDPALLRREAPRLLAAEKEQVVRERIAELAALPDRGGAGGPPP